MNEFMQNPWKGKKVAFLGDSITDKCHVGTTKNYWQFLEEMLGIEPLVYGINGDNWAGVKKQAERLKAEFGASVDAISIFAGTNDYMGGLPLGEWFEVKDESVNLWGRERVLPRRHFVMTDETFRGRINAALSYIKTEFPDQQVFMVTPIHRAFATFSADNVQPEETFPNALGLYVDQYAEVVREASAIWSVPVIDLHSLSGLYPLIPSHWKYFHDTKTDLLHPSAEGHRRMAKVMAAQMLAMPSDFK